MSTWALEKASSRAWGLQRERRIVMTKCLTLISMLLASFLGGALAFCLFGDARVLAESNEATFDTITVKELKVLDQAGDVGAVLNSVGGKVGLAMRGQAGKAMSMLAADGLSLSVEGETEVALDSQFLHFEVKGKAVSSLDAETLCMTDERENQRVLLGASKGKAESKKAVLYMRDQNGKLRSMVGEGDLMLCDKNAEGSMVINAEGLSLFVEAKVRSMLTERGFSVLDENMETRIWLKISDKASEPSIMVLDRAGNTRAVLGVAHTVQDRTEATAGTVESTLTLFNSEGRVVWEAPSSP